MSHNTSCAYTPSGSKHFRSRTFSFFLRLVFLESVGWSNYLFWNVCVCVCGGGGNSAFHTSGCLPVSRRGWGSCYPNYSHTGSRLTFGRGFGNQLVQVDQVGIGTQEIFRRLFTGGIRQVLLHAPHVPGFPTTAATTTACTQCITAL